MVSKRVLLLLPDTNFFKGAQNCVGGHISHVIGVVKALEKFGYKTTIVAEKKVPFLGSNNIVYRLACIPTWVSKIPKVRKLYFSVMLFSKVYFSIKHAEVSFIYMRHSSMGFVGAFISRLTGIPLVIEVNTPLTMHVDPHSRPAAFIRLFNRWSEWLQYKTAKSISVVTKSLKEWIIDNVDSLLSSKIFVNPNGVDTEVFNPSCNGDWVRKKHKINDNDILFALAANYEKWYNVEGLIDAFDKALKVNPSIKLMLIGDGIIRPQMEKYVFDKNLTESIIFEVVNFNKMPEYYAACDILVLYILPKSGKHLYGSPIKLFEYLSMGKPIIAGALEQITEYIKNEINGILVPYDDKDKWCKAILDLASNRNLMTQLGETARNDALRYHSWNNNVRRIIYSLGGA